MDKYHLSMSRRLIMLQVAALLIAASLGVGGAAADPPTLGYTTAASLPAAPDGGPTGCRRGQLNAAPLAYQDLFLDNLENGGGNWEHGGQPDTWQLTTASSHSPIHSWFAQSLNVIDDQQLTLAVSVTLPITPPSAGLAFWQLYNFRQGNADGGVVEYQPDPGTPWQDAGPLFVQNGYTGVISGSGNPLNGRSGFVGNNPDNPQYTASILNLTTLLGHSPSFRFRLGTGSGGFARGWNIDDIEIYICLAGTPTPTIAPPTATPSNTPTPIGTPTPCGPVGCPTATPSVIPSPTISATLPTLAPSSTPTPTFTPTPGCPPACASPTPITPTATATNCVNPFVDIAGNIFYAAIHYLNCRGVINGTDATHYSPAGTSTRGQFAKVVALGFGLPSYTPATPDFSDVPASYFAYAYIESGYHAGILSGFDMASCAAHGVRSPCYLPNLPITRGQLTKLVVGAAHYPLYTPTGGGQDFTDVPPSNVFYASIETAHYKGVINGYADGTFRPNNNIRRDEMAQIIYAGITHQPYTNSSP